MPLLLGFLSSILWAVPAALRTDAGPLGLLGLAAGASSLLVPLVWSFSKLRPLSQTQRGVLLGLAFSLLPLGALGALLKTATHHRPLGAVTFAFLSAGISCFLVLVFIRALRSIGSWKRGDHILPWVLWTLAGLVVLASVGILFTQTAGVQRGMVIDLIWGIVLCAATLRLDDNLRRNPQAARGLKKTPAWVPLALWLGTAAVAVLLPASHPPDVAESAPLLASPWLILFH